MRQRNLILIMMFLILPLNGFSQNGKVNISDPNINSWKMKRHYFSISFESETSVGLKGGFSFGYSHKIGHENKYYLGIEILGFPSRSSRPISVYYQGFETRNGNLESTLSMFSFLITQKYFLHPESKNTPFFSLGIGSRSVQSELDTDFIYYSGFPFGWLPNGDYVSVDNNGTFCLNAGGGYWFNLFQNRGLYVKMEIVITSNCKVIDEGTVYYSTEGLQYSTYNSNSVFLNIGVGFML